MDRARRRWLSRLATALLASVAVALPAAQAAPPSRATLRLAHRAHADVNGDGRADLITAEPGRAGGTLRVALTGGATLSARTRSDAPFLPGLVAVGNVDGRPGAELFVDVGHVTTEEEIRIYTLWRGQLRSAGDLPAFGEDDGIRYGITCGRRAGRRVVVDHDFVEQFSAHPRYWTRRDSVYRWGGPKLRLLVSQRAERIAGAPPSRQLGVQCGRPA